MITYTYKDFDIIVTEVYKDSFMWQIILEDGAPQSDKDEPFKTFDDALQAAKSVIDTITS